MAEKRHIDLFCEDLGHELFVRALVSRLSREVGVSIKISSRSVRGGHGRAISDFVKWQQALRGGASAWCWR